MSRATPSVFETRQLGFECELCGAPVEAWCTTRTGRWSTHIHSERYYKAMVGARR